MSQKNRLLENFPPAFILAVLSTIFLAIAFSWLEYHFINVESLPYREARPPTVAFLYPYQLAVYLPFLLLLAFYPLLMQFTHRTKASVNLKRPMALGIGTLLLALVLMDGFWFFMRLLAPTATDPLANQWIRPTDYTASWIGYAQISGAVIPLWYLAFFPIILASIVSLIISPSQT